MRTKSGSYIKVSFSIFNSLGLSSDVPLMSLTIILPRRSLILVLWEGTTSLRIGKSQCCLSVGRSVGRSVGLSQ